MPTLKTYRLFISHAWTYGDEYQRLVNLLDAAPNFDWADYSVPEDDPLHGGSDAQLRAGLERQMRLASAVLVISGVYATNRRWMQEEIDIALRLNRPIIGLFPHGSQRASQAVQEVATEMVNWSTSSIVSAIRDHAL